MVECRRGQINQVVITLNENVSMYAHGLQMVENVLQEKSHDVFIFCYSQLD